MTGIPRHHLLDVDPDDFDPDFEPLSRPRSCTWPLPRPEVCDPPPAASSSPPSPPGGAVSSNLALLEETEDFDENHHHHHRHHHPGPPPHPPPSSAPPPAPPRAEFHTLESGSAAHVQQSQQPRAGLHPHVGHQQQQLAPPASAASASSAVAPRKSSSSRRNAWGNMSYADLITKAIDSSPERRLTLAQIYDWMVKSVPYFKDKGDSNSSAGWKNSIRHNLSLHSRFMRMQNEGTGKSSWWMLNPEGGKSGKSPRRRAASMDNNSKFAKSRGRAAKKKVSLQEHSDGGVTSPAPLYSKWMESPNPHSNDDFDTWSTFRTRTSSDASTLSGRHSPFLSEQDDMGDVDIVHIGYPGGSGAKLAASPLPSVSELPGPMSQRRSEGVMESLLDNMNLCLSPKIPQLAPDIPHPTAGPLLQKGPYSATAAMATRPQRDYLKHMPYGQQRMTSLSPVLVNAVPEAQPGFGSFENHYNCHAGLLKELLTSNTERGREQTMPPGEMVGNLPGHGGSSLPGHGGSSLPGHGGSSLPGHGGSSLPGHGGSSLPGHGGSSLPGHGGSSLPGHGGSSLPGHGGSSLPGHGGSSLPHYGSHEYPGVHEGVKMLHTLAAHPGPRRPTPPMVRQGPSRFQDLNNCNMIPLTSISLTRAPPRMTNPRTCMQMPPGRSGHVGAIPANYGGSSGGYRGPVPGHLRGQYPERLPSDLDNMALEMFVDMECDMESVLHETLMDGDALDFNFDPTGGPQLFAQRVKNSSHSWVSG